LFCFQNRFGSPAEFREKTEDQKGKRSKDLLIFLSSDLLFTP